MDLDRDGIGDIVRIAQAPSKPGVELWLSASQRVLRLKSKTAISSIAVADLDADGWPEVLAGSASSAGPGVRVWKNAGHGAFQQIKRRHRGRHGRLSRHTGGHVGDQPDQPPSSVPAGAFQDTGPAVELSYFDLQLTLSGCTILVQGSTPPSSIAPPRSPRAPPALTSM